MEDAATKANDKVAFAGDPKLRLWDAVSIIIGIVIGAGIYETAPFVLANVKSPAHALAVWALGGALSLIGAACYAELASTYPRSGGDYVYLTRAFSPAVGFLFGWAQLAVILTGSIGMMAFVFADYAAALWGTTPSVAAALSVIVITAFNAAGVALGKTAQNVLSVVKVLGLTLVVVAGLAFGEPSPAAPTSAAGAGSFGLAMILVLYTYGGWNDAAFVAAEVRDPGRNIPRALLLGTLVITVIYLLVNTAFMVALGFENARGANAIAGQVLAKALGPTAGAVMSLLVMISALGAVNGLTFTGSRVYSSLGADHSLFRGLSRWHPRLKTPVFSLLVQASVTVLMILIVGTSAGRGVIDGLLVAFGGAPAKWAGHGGFDTLLSCTAPVFWAFFLLTGLSLFVLRIKDRTRPRPFKVPLYPVLPLVFVSTCVFMLYSAVDYAGKLTLFGVIPVLLGVPLYFLSRRVAAPSYSASTGE
jgi:basic amino acid/polyamine antiporter, APA family